MKPGTAGSQGQRRSAESLRLCAAAASPAVSTVLPAWPPGWISRSPAGSPRQRLHAGAGARARPSPTPKKQCAGRRCAVQRRSAVRLVASSVHGRAWRVVSCRVSPGRRHGGARGCGPGLGVHRLLAAIPHSHSICLAALRRRHGSTHGLFVQVQPCTRTSIGKIS